MNVKLSNGVEYSNTHFQPSFGEYLIQNGFKVDLSKKSDSLLFYKSNQQLHVRGSSLDFLVWNTLTLEWDYKAGHIGIDGMEIQCFILLVHIMGVQDVRLFEDNASMISHQIATEAWFLKKSILYMLENKKQEVAHA